MKEQLTSREIEVLSMIVNGSGDQEISHSLDMTLRSIEIYKDNLMKIAGVKTLPHLIKWYYTTYKKPETLIIKEVEEKKSNIMCQGCVERDAKIRRLKDKLWEHNRTNLG